MPQPRAIKPPLGLRSALNATGTDIAAYLCVIKDTTEDQVTLPAGSTAAIAGVTTEVFTTDDGVRYTYQTSGRAIVRATAAAITAGDLVMPDATGAVLTRTGTNSILGTAVGDCAASDLVEVDINILV
ncbi:MAG TPA: capsid cement protein, partial [Thermoleophilia bacterium]|nr:capsid cement protein [Thermoleophilia bacterium]